MSENERGDSCSVCHGVGYRTIDGPDGLGYAAPCDCLGERMRLQQARAASIPEKYAGASFESFNTGFGENPIAGNRLSTAHVLARKWSRDFLPGPQYGADLRSGLLFIGEPGSGKTHLAVSALKAILGRGFSGIFRDFRTLLNQVAAGWKPHSTEVERRTLREAIETDVLLIDDLGALRTMDWAEDIITEIITERYNANRAVIVTTNLPLVPESVPAPSGFMRPRRTIGEVVGERAKSRLVEMCTTVDLRGIADYRERYVSSWRAG